MPSMGPGSSSAMKGGDGAPEVAALRAVAAVAQAAHQACHSPAVYRLVTPVRADRSENP
jgi:hypothetical protein